MSNLHTHCNFCDGYGDPEQYIGKGIKKGFQVLGFSSHAPVPFANSWAIKDYVQTNNYLTEVRTLKDKYIDSMVVYAGLEIDYFEADKRNIFNKFNLDYMIGSVHYIPSFDCNRYYAVDGKEEELNELCENNFSGNYRKLVECYYDLIVSMIEKQQPDIVGHLDLVKKNNIKYKYFTETENWYQKMLKKVLYIISKNNLIVEVNTGGLNRHYLSTVYPSPWILKECRKLNIPIIINSDAHAPDQIDGNYHTAYRILTNCGYQEQMCLVDSKWTSIKF